jgi:hypothetical protein
VIFPDPVHLGRHTAAVIKDIRTAIAEQAAGRQIEQGRHNPGNRLEPMIFSFTAQHGD